MLPQTLTSLIGPSRNERYLLPQTMTPSSNEVECLPNTVDPLAGVVRQRHQQVAGASHRLDAADQDLQALREKEDHRGRRDVHRAADPT